MAHVLGLKRLDLYLQFDRPLTEAELAAIRAQVVARGDLRPVAYLVGEREFYSLSFAVDERVLVPRPETEHLVELAIERCKTLEAPAFADVGTGSGCIAVAVLHACPGASAFATDVSPGALEVAAANAARHDVSDRLELLEGDLLAPLRERSAWGRLALVLSNPPYIVRSEPAVEEGVRRHEPDAALFVPGDDPLAIARRLAEQAREALAPGGLLAIEVGHTSGQAARAMLADLGYTDVALVKDLGGIERVVTGASP